MKVYMIREQQRADVNDSYALRLIEQGRAIPAGKGDEKGGKAQAVKLGTGADKDEIMPETGQAPRTKGKRPKDVSADEPKDAN